jgi:hypothetical protein
MDPRIRTIIIAVVTLVVGLLGGSIIWDEDESSPPPDVTVTQPIVAGDLAATDPEDENRVTIAPADSDLRDETPEGVPTDTLRAGKDRVEGLEPLQPKPVGGAQNYEIRQDFSGAVWSSRNGAVPREACLHYTVSGNVTGWGDVYAIRDYFKRTRVGSATFIVDFEGHILQQVPRDQKPWTQGFFNPWCISWEIIATGSETKEQWLASPLIRNRILSSHVRDELRRMGAPLKFVDPVGCNVPAGWTDHNAFECGNDHHDVTPNFPYAVFQRQLLEGPCGKGCEALKAREKASHRRYRARDCKRRPHRRKVSELNRAECRRVKRKIHEQHVKLRRFGL